KVADFGLAKIYDPGDAASTIIGTPYFMPPEQFEGKVRDGRTDIYALGVTLYYMLTLKRPFDGKTPAEVLLNIVKKDPVHPREHNPDISDALWKIIRKMICRNVDERYSTCEELLRDIRVYQEGESTEEKVFCPKCGIGNPFSAEHCMECDTSLLEPCPVCGKPDFVDAKFCGSCGANLGREREVVTLLGEAESHVVAGRIESAIETYESAREISEQNSKVIEGLDVAQKILTERDETVAEVRQLLEGGDSVAAHEAAEKAMERFPGHEPLGELLAQARDSARNERIAAALDEARARLEAGEFFEAGAAARRALEIDPESDDGQALLEMAEKTEAEFSEARERAAALEEDGLLSDAMDCWKTVAKIAPGDAAATEAMERLRGTVDQVDALRTAGEEALAANDLVAARSNLEAAAALLPSDAGVLTALDSLREAEQSGRDSLIAGIEKLISGQYEECRSALEDIESQRPGDETVVAALAQAEALQAAADALLSQGRALVEAGRPEVASVFLRAAERVSPLDGRAEQVLGELKASKKEHTQALEAVRELISSEDWAGAADQVDALGGVASPQAEVAQLAREVADGMRESRRRGRDEQQDSLRQSLETARELLGADRPEAALAACQKALRIDRSHAEARELKSEIDAALVAETAGEPPAGTPEAGAFPVGEEGA
ncbi:MAG: zinc ribbon domain-containing protein, partial [Planctomycetota bacterium]